MSYTKDLVWLKNVGAVNSFCKDEEGNYYFSVSSCENTFPPVEYTVKTKLGLLGTARALKENGDNWGIVWNKNLETLIQVAHLLPFESYDQNKELIVRYKELEKHYLDNILSEHIEEA